MADDSMLIRRVLLHMLEAVGVSRSAVVEAADGYQAWFALGEKGPFDLLLLDMIMPGLDGYELLRRVTRDPRFRHLCIVVVSADGSQRSVNEALAAGARGYIRKPFDRDRVMGRLRQVLEDGMPNLAQSSTPGGDQA